MAILDFLVPDLAPEQYSSGQGTGYAQQYDLGAPNPFDVAQQYADKAVQTKKLEFEKDLLNEKNRQEAFSKYITDIKYDPKWVIAESNFEQEVDDIGNFISEWRASGKPVNTEFQIELNKKKARLNSLKGMNDEAFTRYNKNMQTMLAGLGKDYEQKDINEYEEEVKKAYEQGGVEAGFDKINQLRPLKQFDLIGHLTQDFPVAENETGKRLQTKPEELDRFARLKWDDLTNERKIEVMEDAYLNNHIKEKTPEATIEYFRKELELWDKDQVAKPSAPRSSGSKKDTNVYQINTDTLNQDDPKRGLKKDDINMIKLQTGSNNKIKVISLKGAGTNDIPEEVIPVSIEPFMDGNVRKYKVNAIPIKDFYNVSGSSGISKDQTLTPNDVNENMSKAKGYPLSGFDNFDVINQNYKGLEKVINEQEARDTKRGIKQEEKGLAIMY
jgi:hypothetical protein